MNWFLVKLIFCLEKEPAELKKVNFEEQLRLIREISPDLAILKARKLGKQMESPSRTFIDLREIIAIDSLVDGVELDSSLLETDDREKFIHSVLLKSLRLQKSEAILS